MTTGGKVKHSPSSRPMLVLAHAADGFGMRRAVFTTGTSVRSATDDTQCVVRVLRSSWRSTGGCCASRNRDQCVHTVCTCASGSEHACGLFRKQETALEHTASLETRGRSQQNSATSTTTMPRMHTSGLVLCALSIAESAARGPAARAVDDIEAGRVSLQRRWWRNNNARMHCTTYLRRLPVRRPL